MEALGQVALELELDAFGGRLVAIGRDIEAVPGRGRVELRVLPVNMEQRHRVAQAFHAALQTQLVVLHRVGFERANGLGIRLTERVAVVETGHRLRTTVAISFGIRAVNHVAVAQIP